MKLTKAQKANLRAKGFNESDIRDVEAELVTPETDDGPGRRSRDRVAILEGSTATSFLERWFGPSDEADTDTDESGDGDADGDDEGGDDDADDDETDTGTDDKPESAVGYFKDRKRRSA